MSTTDEIMVEDTSCLTVETWAKMTRILEFTGRPVLRSDVPRHSSIAVAPGALILGFDDEVPMTIRVPETTKVSGAGGPVRVRTRRRVHVLACQLVLSPRGGIQVVAREVADPRNTFRAYEISDVTHVEQAVG